MDNKNTNNGSMGIEVALGAIVEAIRAGKPVDTYSSGEVDTGKRWFDGRIIYRKAFSGVLNVVAGSGVNAFAHGIEGITATSMVVASGGTITLGTTSGFFGLQILPFLNGNDRFHMAQMIATHMQYHATFSWGNSRYLFWVEYVK